MDRHPVLATAGAVADLLAEVAEVPVEFLPTEDKREALLMVERVAARLESLRLRLISAAGDVADADGCRDVATWLVAKTRAGRGSSRRAQRVADRAGAALRPARAASVGAPDPRRRGPGPLRGPRATTAGGGGAPGSADDAAGQAAPRDGSTLFRITVPDAAADRLLTYLHAFTSPRRTS